MKIYRRKLYTRMKEHDYGAVMHSVIIFDKRPSKFFIKNFSADKEAITKGYQVKRTVVQYKCFLQIDLWVVVLNFDWVTPSEEKSNE